MNFVPKLAASTKFASLFAFEAIGSVASLVCKEYSPEDIVSIRLHYFRIQKMLVKFAPSLQIIKLAYNLGTTEIFVP